MRSLRSFLSRSLLACTAAALAACSVKGTNFQEAADAAATDPDGPSVDAAITDGSPDATPAVLAFVLSSHTVEVAEGAQTTVDVSLSAAPTGPVLATIAGTNGAKLGLAPTALLFEASSWDTPQALTLSGLSDVDIVDETAQLTISAAQVPTQATVDVTVHDDDGLALIVSPGMLDVNEEASAQLSVHLSAQPSGTVTVDVVSDDLTVATLDTAQLSFTPATWNLDQVITVSGTGDANTTTDAAHAKLTGTGLIAVSIPIQVFDNDVLAIEPTTTNLGAIAEATGTEVGVALTQEPAADVTVTITAADPARITPTPTTLTFTPADWNVAQTVAVGVLADDDTADQPTSLTLAAPGLADRTIAIVAQDVDTQDIVAVPGAVVVGEGASAPVAIHLAYRPAAPITIDVQSLSGSVATVAPATLTFAVATYDQPQTVTVTAPQDLDVADGATTIALGTATLNLSQTVPVTVKDDDQLTIVTSAANVTLGEAASATFQVKLGAQPAGTVNVSVTSNDATAATVSPGALSFTAATWNTFQTVTVTGVADLDLANEAPLITLAAAGVPVHTVAAAVTDDDSQNLVVSAAMVNVTEGATGTFTVKLAYMPAANVSVNATSRDGAIAAASPATLTFTPANYATAQTVTITGVQDPDASPAQTGIDVASAGLSSQSVTVNVADDDSLGIQATTPSLNVSEGQQTTVGVRLTAQPAANTSVAVASTDPGAATATPATLTFTPANWATYQNVTVTGAPDADAADDASTLHLTATGLATIDVAVAVIDDDAQNVLTSVNAVGLTETGSATFGVHLAAAPASDVVVAVGSSDPGAATVSTAILTFTPATWNIDQIVKVSGVDDLDLGNESVAITLTSTGLAPRTVTATVTDDDSQVVLVNPAAMTITEGAQGTFQVALAYAPTGNAVVTIAPANGAVTTTPPTLTFTAANYSQAQSVTVTGVQDADAVAAITSVSASAPGATAGSVTVTVADDDVLGIQASTSLLPLGEAGMATFGVRLTAQPIADTTIFIASNDAAAAAVSLASVTFTPTNYATYQTVTVTGVADLDAADEAVAISLTNGNLTTVTVTASVTDDEVQAILTDVAAISLGEGSTATFKVKLAAQPLANTTVGVSSNNLLVATTNTSLLTFTPANYATYQTVTVTGVQDANLVSNGATITMSSVALPSKAVTATVTDNDVQSIIRTPSSLVVNEGGTGTFQVSLAYQPTANVAVSVTSNATGTAVVSLGSLTFTPANYATPQTVTVSGVEDADLTFDATTITLASAGITSATTSVTVTDNDLITATPLAATLCGGDTIDVNLHLLAKPYASVAVSASTGNVAVGTVSPLSHLYTTSNYATNQVYTITAKGGTTQKTTTITFDSTSQNPKVFNLTVLKNADCL